MEATGDVAQNVGTLLVPPQLHVLIVAQRLPQIPTCNNDISSCLTFCLINDIAVSSHCHTLLLSLARTKPSLTHARHHGCCWEADDLFAGLCFLATCRQVSKLTVHELEHQHQIVLGNHGAVELDQIAIVAEVPQQRHLLLKHAQVGVSRRDHLLDGNWLQW